MESDNAYARHLYDFVLEVAVECPRCRKEALVQTDRFPPSTDSGKEPRLTCIQCGYNQLFSEKIHENNQISFILGEPVDPFFHLPLWLQLRCGDEWLWAYNREHLRVLETHIRQLVRSRNGLPVRNNSIGSRLPRWMMAAKNREMVLDAIRRMQQGEREAGN